MTGFDDLTVALRMRDTIQRLVREEVDRYRPADKFGRVIDVNRLNSSAQVLLNGDIEAITVRVPRAMQPLQTDVNSGSGNGCMVLIGGTPGNLWIKDIVSGNAFSNGTALYRPRLYGGTLQHLSVAQHTALESSLPALGNAWHFGRWDNSASFSGDGTGYVWVCLRHDLFSSIIKTYQIPVRANGSGGNWRKVAPETYSGSSVGHDVELEMKVDATGFEFQARRTNDAAGFTPGGYTLEVWAHFDSISYIDGSSLGEVVTAVPTQFIGTESAVTDKGPFLSPGMHIPRLSQMTLSGGGRIYYTNGAVNWSSPFRIYLGVNQYAPNGFYEISLPVVGTVVPIYGDSSLTSVAVTTDGIRLDDGWMLFYEPPWGSPTTTSDPARFRILTVSDLDDYFEAPSHWILVAHNPATSNTASVMLGNGVQIGGPAWDTWAPTVTGSGGGGTVGNASINARWTKRRGERTVDFQMNFIYGSTSSFGTGVAQFSLPLIARSTAPTNCGYGLTIDTSASFRRGVMLELAGTGNQFLCVVAESGSIVSSQSSIPHVWASGDELRVSGTYEVAS